MLALSLAVSAVLGLLALWVFAPLFIALAAGAVVALMLLALAGRMGRMGSMGHAERTARTLPVAGWWAIALCAGAACVAMLVLLPDRLDGAPFLAFGMGLLLAICAGALVWLTCWLIAGRQPVPVSWWTGSALAALGAFLALLRGGPDTAGWMAWRAPDAAWGVHRPPSCGAPGGCGLRG
jgi:hypothetical protein